MVLLGYKKDADMRQNMSLDFNIDGFHNIVLVTSETMKCFGSKSKSHLNLSVTE